MAVTSRGKSWEILHSLWIGWTFTLGFFNWVAFLYVGLRARQKKWIFWSLFYAVPFTLAMLTPDLNGFVGDLIVFLTVALGVAGIVHAFRIREEYLIRLATLQQKAHEADALLRTSEAGHGMTAPGPTGTNANASGRNMETSADSPDQPVRHSRSNVSDALAAGSSPRQTTVPAQGSDEPWSGDELEYRISNAYPFPLAYGYRSLMSIVDARDLYREQLRVAENMLAFLGSVSLSLLREQERKEAGVNPKDYWLTGISPGDWKEIVGRCSKTFVGYKDDPLALAIKGLNIRSEKKEESFGANVAALIRAKNDYKHDRGPVVLEDIAEASSKVQGRLRRCMEVLEFLTAFPIRQVEDFDIARRGGDATLKCLRYTGDHPSFPQEEVPFDRALPRGDLFLDLGQRGWVPLFPFMTTTTCSHCKVRETYFIDAWDTRRNIARMKSFERGHTTTSTEVSEALSEWAGSVQSDGT
jgi:hypothetical protein